MAAWQPSPDGLNQLLGLLRMSVQAGADNQKHRDIQQHLTSYNNVPDYNSYLVHIISQLKEEATNVRQLAGLVLKNNLRERWMSLSPEVMGYVKDNLIHSLGDDEAFIRSTVGSCVTTVVTAAGLESWPQLMPTLVHLLDSPSPNLVEGAYNAVAKICEDSADALVLEPNQATLHVLVPKFLRDFASPNATVRKLAVGSVNQFVQVMPEALGANLDAYLQALFSLAVDPTDEVRKRVCQALVTLLDVYPECLQPHLKQVIEYMLVSTQDSDELVALEACEFWSAICDSGVAKEQLAECLPRLLPILLDSMVYSEFDLMVLGHGEDDDEGVADRPEDIKPHFHKSKLAGGGGGGGGGSGGGTAEADDAEDEDDEDGDDDDPLGWTLRKCAASGLDSMAGLFQEDILPVLLPLLHAKLSDERWDVREAAILALGAIADGCTEGLQPHLPQLMPWLLQTLSDSKPLIRNITCWTLSRYAAWAVHTHPPEQYFQPLMQELLKRVLDTNKRVQESACSAFAEVEEKAGPEITPYLGPILPNLMFAFGKYQAKNLTILLDCIGTLADCVGSALGEPGHVRVLMPPLISRWNSLYDQDRALIPLLECLSCIAQALGPGFREYAEPVYARCLRLMELNMRPQQPPVEQDSEFVVCALDLISGLAEGLRGDVEALIGSSTLLPLLADCMRSDQADVRQSAYALVGDLAKSAPGVLRPVFSEMMPLMLTQLNPEHVSVCNNATWAIGELAVKVGADMRPFVPDLVALLVPIVKRDNLNKSLLENTAITIGRLGLVAPELVAPLLEQFAQPWCNALRNIRDDIEKEHAFRGLCEMIKINPQGVVTHFVHLCDAIASWQSPPPDLNDMFNHILQGYKATIPQEHWGQFYGAFPDNVRQLLTQRYGL